MDVDPIYFNEKRRKAREIYLARREIYSPYFKTKVVLNSDGFSHLQFSGRMPRGQKEQLFKFSLLPLGLEIIEKSGTIQEYRKVLSPIGKRSATDGAIPMKEIEYWGMIAIVGEKKIRVKTILRRVGDGNITFWSVMLYSKMKNGKQKIFTEGIEEE